MAVSAYFTNEELEAQLRLQFENEAQWDIDFSAFFNQIVDRGVDLYLEIRNRKFSIDKLTGYVTEVK